VKHKEPDPDQDERDDKEGTEENERRHKEGAKEATPVVRRLIG
jgi:hypothetical protein